MNMNTQHLGEAEIKIGLLGRYQLHAHKVNAAGEIISSRLVADWFDNLITDSGLDSIGITTTYAKINGCVVGTGNTPPVNADIALANYRAATNTVQSPWAGSAQISVAPFYESYKITYRFNTGVAAGNLTEVGLGGQTNVISSTSKLFSRALILDGSGNPTTITILSDEVLDVTYELRLYLPNGGADVTGIFNQTIDGVVTAFNYTIRAASVNSNNPSTTYQRWAPTAIWQTTGPTPINANQVSYGVTTTGLVAITAEPNTGGVNQWTGWGSGAYTPGNLYIDTTWSLGLNNGNVNFVTYVFWWGNMCTFQMNVSPAVAKNNTKTYSITMRLAWGRYAP